MIKPTTALTVLLLSTSVTLAHSWYPAECCSDRDCEVVLEEWSVPEGMAIRTKHGIAIFPVNHPVRPSQDQHDHACFDPSTKRPICLFRAAKV